MKSRISKKLLALRRFSRKRGGDNLEKKKDEKGKWGVRWLDRQGGFSGGLKNKAEAETIIRQVGRPGRPQRIKTHNSVLSSRQVASK